MGTTMWQSPGFNEDLLNKFGCFDDIYKALGSNDLSDIVVTALNVLNKTGSVPLIKIEKKSEAISTDFRKQGNEAYTNKKYQEALILYNKALQYAPVDSKVMKLAFSNRSALFMTVKAFGASVGDIDIVFDMGCPPEILAKLEQRHKEASNAMRSEDSYWKTLPKSGYTFCTLKEMPNPLITCATKNVGVFMENDIPKIVAANHIKVGTVLAIEPAFVSHLDPGNLMVACYYCHRLDYNLVACEGCCHVMFCNEYCMRDSMDQYHSIECKIMDLLHYIDCNETLRLAIKAAIKIKLKSSWENVIDFAKLFGVERMKKSSISLIFSHLFSSSLLQLKEERHFIYGAMYNVSFKIAAVIHYLGLEKGFFPDLNNRDEAIKCFGRIIMYLYLYGHPTLIVNAVSINDAPQVEFHKLHNFGFFSFTGKLKNSCMPNVMTVGLNDKVALVALEPISRGTELTIAYTFPENPNLHQKWIAATGRTNWTAKKSSKICSRHFEQHELIKKKKITLLLPNAVPSQIKNPAIGDDVVDVMPSTSNQDHIMEIDSAESFTTSLIQQPVNVHQPLIAPIPASTSVAGTNITTKPDATDNIVPSTTVLKHLDIEPDVELSASSVLLSVDDGPDYTPRTLKRKWKKSEEKATERLKKLKALREKSRRLSKKVANLEKMIAELKAVSD
ncbi:hypothetical protein MSG28_013494 [Choristoneura fumiferana]|uniref:Uncharacterized protein n=1 Tax=Choristoneura fumiferana TaxID=7141 RepID=A0ACC0KU68_CHOFU|nr:hypothetical protein MSG28_013494 [Choristoneura fumiferana]